VSALAEGSGSELAEGSGEIVRLGAGVGDAVALGAGVGVGVGVGEGVGLAITTGTSLQVEPQPVAVADRVTEARLMLLANTSVPAVGSFPKKVTVVRELLLNALLPMLVTEFPIVTVVRRL
jgi:hypothetical protein